MDRFYIIPNSAKDPELTFSNMIIDYLEEHGARCHVQKITEKMEGPYHYTDPDGIPEDTQCIIVLGGDGTLLQAARDVVHLDIPLLGINLGTLGFLAEVDKNSVYPALDRLLTDDYELEERMMLEGKIYRGDELVGKDIALNDIVIGREGHLRVYWNALLSIPFLFIKRCNVLFIQSKIIIGQRKSSTTSKQTISDSQEM